jgi:hypothetical protein
MIMTAIAGAGLPDGQDGAGFRTSESRVGRSSIEGFTRMRKSVRALALSILAVIGTAMCCAFPARAQQFSAEIISRSAAGAPTGAPARLYVADRKVRIETPELPDSVLIVDGVVPAAYMVAPAQRAFIDARQTSRLTRLFVSLDPDDPCAQWQAMAEVAGLPDQRGQWHCDVADRETIQGRNTVKFIATSPQGHSAGWIDPHLKFPLKIEAEDGSVLELRNIEETPQPAERFAIPSDYKKYDLARLIEYLKHTDIWVEPPR